MELASILESSIANQGLMFWSASAAVALGVTLILISGIIQFRRLRSRSASSVPSASVLPPEQIEIPSEIPSDLEMNKESQKTSEWPECRVTESNPKQLRLLLARLRTAADQLEDYRRINRVLPPKSAESSLKESAEGVDYLFRTGTG